MKKIEAIIRVCQLQYVIDALVANDIHGLTCTNVQGYGRQHGNKEVYRANTLTTQFVDKVKIEVVLPAEKLEVGIETIMKNALTGEVGDGKIFVYDVAKAYRIRTGESDTTAL